jgi:hypothetical protein
MSIRGALEAMRGPVAFWAVAGVGLFVSHDAIFLVQLGPGDALVAALRAAGHDYWGLASALLVLLGLATMLAVIVRLRALRRQAAELGADRLAVSDRPYLARMLGAWGRLMAVVAIGFAIQENVEHVIGHAHAPGIGALLGPEYPLALPVIAMITGLGALLAAAVVREEQRLLAAIAGATRRSYGRPPRQPVRRPIPAHVVRVPILARASPERAPPELLAIN